MINHREEGTAKLIAVVQRMVEESGDPVNFDAEHWVRAWLDTPLPALGNHLPISYLDSDGGLELLESLLIRTQSGAFS
ncbi:antitoxin Xre/MbcA/ParS toxin-binding domain-containing protein [Dyella subtropica]|uniref:antitoxin Xre/MbcA/ParS toxin-binding domain-containing protein n=1 Tax=Dyella subtropica TaxID=2992127 RepID=UPI0022534FB0|nr:antitoxin Xre/MbcA/ParS toxin-binding domain-containing protein [Dyella subtropica]